MVACGRGLTAATLFHNWSSLHFRHVFNALPSLSPLSEDFLKDKIFQANLQEISKQVCSDIPLEGPPSNRTSREFYCKISKKIECISEISVSQWLANLTQLSRRIYRQNLWFNKIEDSVKPSRIFQENTKHTENFMLFNF